MKGISRQGFEVPLFLMLNSVGDSVPEMPVKPPDVYKIFHTDYSEEDMVDWILFVPHHLTIQSQLCKNRL